MYEDSPALAASRPHSVLAIPGSLRRASCNRMLLEAAAAHAPPGIAVRLYDGLAAVPLFSEDVEAEAIPGGVRHLREHVAQADALLIATPEYNQSIPGVLKNAIDWLSRGPEEVLNGKPVAIAGATKGRWGTRLAQSHLRHVLYATEALVMAQPSLFLAEAGRLFDSAGQLTDEATARSLREYLLAFSHWITRVGEKAAA